MTGTRAKVTIDDFAARLCAIPEAEFTHQAVLDFLRENPVDARTLAPYLYFSAEKYTRNLIRRTPLF
ncbi:MAG TPA: hypothetical protein VGS58_01840, partial [Candidatus Sulfopaludibacter sp.]|nr:hypothetical protein [Candidatus Sulfopaludibacter sp.]